MGAAFPFVLACFVLSGFAALLYQTAWTREFAFVFGTSELAVATVLAAYMGGLSAGAALGGRLAGRIRRPILVYGLLELGIAVAALAVPSAIDAATTLAVTLFGGAPEPPEAAGTALPAFYLITSFAILLVPTALMGATLPLLARHAVRRQEELGPRIAVLYAANTGGAVLGTLAAAFALLPAFGLHGTVLVGVAANAAVFALAAVLATRAPALEPEPGDTARPRADRRRMILPLIALSGTVSFTYEVLWTRLLGHVLGGSVYAFATMLASFLLGIAVGSALAARRARTPSSAAGAFAVAQIGIALASWAAFVAVDALPALAGALGAGVTGHLAANALLCGALLLPSTLFVGATFPLAVRVLARDEHDAAPASARVFAWNTVGAIVGAIGAGFFVIPGLGYAGTLALGVATSLALALSAALFFGPRRAAGAGLAGVLLLALAVVRPAPPWNLLRSSPLQLVPLRGEVAWFSVGRSATVIAIEHDGAWKLRTNGLPEAEIRPPGRDPGLSVNDWLAALPVLMRPTTRSELIIGFGGGSVVEAVPESVERVDVIELEPDVIAANRALADRRARDPLADPRLRVHLNDARGALLLTEHRWDAIVSQPSHPWTAGASHLYTRDFFELVASRLAPAGVFVQWIGMGFVDEELTRVLVASLRSVFTHVQVVRPRRMAALLFVASDAPLDLAGVDEALRASPRALDRLGIDLPEDVAAAILLDSAGAARFSAGAPVSRDDRNLLQMNSPRTIAQPLSRGARADLLFAPHDAMRPPPAGLDGPLLVSRIAAGGAPDRARRVAGSLPDPVERELAGALAEGAAGTTRLEAFLTEHPESVLAAAALASLTRAAPDPRAPPLDGRLAALSDAERAVLAGWGFERRRDAGGLAALDSRLAAVPSTSPLLAPALRLRALWRVETRREAERALELAGRALARVRTPPHRILRARAAAQAGHPGAALADLRELVAQIRRITPPLARALRAALAELPPDPLLAAERRALLEDVTRAETRSRRRAR